MAVFKCKICGGSLEVQEGMSVCECEYCGTKQTLPKMNDDRRVNLYDRANHFRRNNEFDKAMSMYEQILQEDREDAEAYWSLVLCTYGIEYVEDPASHTRKPTINRTQFTSIFADENYRAALRYADESQRQIYEEEAKQIDGIQKGILDISNQEEPFDVFICYKETDASGQRTQDFVLANDLYHQLTQEGFKVFFARITLEDKLGSAYEPYIFAALNSSKVMVVLGTRPEYFNAVWVRNEWSRYLSLIKNGAKKVLIPAYKDMDPYDLPQEFSHLQSQDMGKLGFMQDLIRGVKKLTGTDKPAQAAGQAATGNNTEPLLRRVFLFLEDGDFAKADEYCERVLNLDPENAEAYMGKLMLQLKVRKREELAQCPGRLDSVDAFRKIMRFGGENIKREAEGYNRQIIKRMEEELKRQQKLRQEEQARQREELYQSTLAGIKYAVKSSQLRMAISNLKTLGEYKDAAAQIAAAAEKLAKFEKKERAKRKRLGAMAAMAVVIVFLAGAVFFAIQKKNQYNAAIEQAERLIWRGASGDYYDAYRALKEVMDAEEAKEEVAKVMLSVAIEDLETEEYQKSLKLLEELGKYTDDTTEVATELGNAICRTVEKHVDEGEYDKLEVLLSAIEAISDSIDVIGEGEAATELGNAIYRTAEKHVDGGEYDKLEVLLSVIEAIPDSRDTTEAATELGNAIYRTAEKHVDEGEYDKLGVLLSAIEAIPDSRDTAEAATQFGNALCKAVQQHVNANEYDTIRALRIGKIPDSIDVTGEAVTELGDALCKAVQQNVNAGEYITVNILVKIGILCSIDMRPLCDAIDQTAQKYADEGKYTELAILSSEVVDFACSMADRYESVSVYEWRFLRDKIRTYQLTR